MKGARDILPTKRHVCDGYNYDEVMEPKNLCAPFIECGVIFYLSQTTIFILINLASAAFVCCWNVHDRKKFSELIIAVNQRWDTEMYWSHKIICSYSRMILLNMIKFAFSILTYSSSSWWMLIESSLEQSGLTVSCLQMVCSRCRFSLAESI